MMLTIPALAIWSCLQTHISASDFDTSCAHDADCVLVEVGDTCQCECGESNAAINVNSLAAYNNLFAERKSHCASASFCDCIAGPLDAGGPSAVCEQGQCVFKP
jgi:hypothetical protein